MRQIALIFAAALLLPGCGRLFFEVQDRDGGLLEDASARDASMLVDASSALDANAESDAGGTQDDAGGTQGDAGGIGSDAGPGDGGAGGAVCTPGSTIENLDPIDTSALDSAIASRIAICTGPSGSCTLVLRAFTVDECANSIAGASAFYDTTNAQEPIGAAPEIPAADPLSATGPASDTDFRAALDGFFSEPFVEVVRRSEVRQCGSGSQSCEASFEISAVLGESGITFLVMEFTVESEA